MRSIGLAAWALFIIIFSASAYGAESSIIPDFADEAWTTVGERIEVVNVAFSPVEKLTYAWGRSIFYRKKSGAQIFEGKETFVLSGSGVDPEEPIYKSWGQKGISFAFHAVREESGWKTGSPGTVANIHIEFSQGRVRWSVLQLFSSPGKVLVERIIPNLYYVSPKKKPTKGKQKI